MKYQSLLLALSSITATVFAGTSTYVAPPAAPEPSLYSWFIGGSFGQLYDVDSNLDSLGGGSIEFDDLDLNMYSLHVGRSLTDANGWDIAAFLEVAYLNGDVSGEETIFVPPNSFVTLKEDIDFDIIPVTANIKVERALFGPVSAYATAGAGYAWTEVSAAGDSENDGGFYAQASAGLIYNISEQFEIFGGARWLYLSDVKFGESELELDDSFAWEVGARVNF